jgi:hypothetical protein
MNVAQQLDENMKARSINKQEKCGIVKNMESDVRVKSKVEDAMEVTMFPMFPVDEGKLRILNSNVFSDIDIDEFEEEIPDYHNLEAFIKAIPKTSGYEIVNDEDDTMSRGKVVRLKEDNDGYAISSVPYFHLTKTYNLDDENEGCVLLAYRDGSTRQLSLLMSEVAETTKLIKIMANKGVLITMGADNRNYIYEQNLACSTKKLLSDTIGFRRIEKELCFVYPGHKGVGASIYYSEKDPGMKHALGVQGDPIRWVEGVIAPLNLCNESPTVPFLLFSALLPLFSTLVPGFQGILMNIVPDDTEQQTSSQGKTTCQRAMLSMQGPQEWMVSWNMTAIAIEGKLYDGVGAYFDDLSTSSIQNMEKVVYDNANGTRRGRLNKNGTSQPVKRRNSVIFSSGEAQVLDIEKAKDGALVRAIDIPIRAKDFGSNDISKTKVIADSITATVREHYGFVYWITIHMIISKEAYILEQINRYKQHFVAMAKDPLTKRLALSFAIITVCGDLLIIATQKLSGDDRILSNLDPLHITSNMFKKVMDSFHQKNDRHMIVLDMIKQALILDDDGETILNNFKSPVGIVKNDIWYVKSTQINDIINNIDGAVSRRFFRWAEEEGILCEIDNEEGRYTKTKKLNGTSVNTYAFDFSVETNGNTGISGNRNENDMA